MKNKTQQQLERLVRSPALHDALSIIKAARNGMVYGGKIRFSHALVMSFMFRSGPWMERLQGVILATKTHAGALASFAITYKTVLLLLKCLRAVEVQLGGRLGVKVDKEAIRRPQFKADVDNRAHGIDALIAGMAGGYLVFGRDRGKLTNGITSQVVLYVFSRVVMAFGKLLAIKLARIAVEGYKVYRTTGHRHHTPLEVQDFIGKSEKKSLIFSRIKQRKQQIENTSWAIFSALSWGIVMWLYRVHPGILQRSLEHSMKFIYVDSDVWSGLSDFL